jgi:hypothetical protein
MDPRIESEAGRLFPRILADFAYLFGDPVSPIELPGLAGKGFLARLPFRAVTWGSLQLAVSETLALDIAANTLGTEPGDPEAARRSADAVRELVSILGGHLASSFGGKLELAPPELTVLGRTDWDRIRLDLGTRCFSVESRPALLRVDREQCE